MPEMFSAFMATLFANGMPYIVLLWAFAYLYFAVNLASTKAFQEHLPEAEDMSNKASFSCGIALVCLICPFRSCIEKTGDQSDVNADNTTDYNQRALYFQTDYDRANPLTKKHGEIRILNLQIDQAKQGGDDDAAQALEK